MSKIANALIVLISCVILFVALDKDGWRYYTVIALVLTLFFLAMLFVYWRSGRGRY